MTPIEELMAELTDLRIRFERLQEQQKTKAPCPLEEGKDVWVDLITHRAQKYFSRGVYGYVSVKANSHVSDAYSVNIEIPWGSKSMAVQKAKDIIGSASD